MSKFKRHPNLSDDLNDNIEQSEQDGGVYTRELGTGDSVLVQTKNTNYVVSKTKNGFTIQGHPEHCPTPLLCHINGSTWGGSALKVGWIGVGMHLEYTSVQKRVRVTTEIQSIKVCRVH